jgi:hypothetical protein
MTPGVSMLMGSQQLFLERQIEIRQRTLGF